ncbi:Insulinase (Peptidase family M16) [Cryptosporidium tyzzeri]|nr:Insulinase (Peptidase family M16) [Cryptosporidium tyzzeri]
MKPISDQSFKLLKLNNDIEVILNSAPNVDECTASILNRVGSMHDPSNLHGLGFYLMNIMLSASNSDVGSGLYDFCIDNSLSLSYQIYSTYSLFHVTTPMVLLENILKLISEMLKSPVFTDEVMEKALNILENKTTLDNHSYNIFSTNLVLSDPKSIFTRDRFGSRDTLKTIPQSKKIDVKQSLIKFFNEQYSSNRLMLSLKCNLPIQVMQDLVAKYFNGIINKNLPINTQYKSINNLIINPLSYSVGKIMYRIDESNQTLMLLFPLKNYLQPYMKSGPIFFINNYICANKEGTLMRFLKQKNYIKNMNCHVSNDMSGFSNIQFSFNLTNNGLFNVQNIIRAFFLSINKIKDLKLDINIYNKTNQNILKEIKSSNKYFANLNSLSILNNYFKFNSSSFKSIILGVNEFSNFDLNLHRQILMEINPQNMIIIFNLKGDKETIEDTGELTLFDQSILNKDCTKYEEFLSQNKKFRYVVLTNVLSKEFKEVIKTNNKFRFILEEQNFCLKKYISHFPESLTQELKIYDENKDPKTKDNLENYNIVERLVVPKKLRDLLSSDSSQRATNFPQFQDFYYFIPHTVPTHKIYLAINFFFPFENKKMASIRSTRIATILLFIKEILLSFSENISSHLANHSIDFIPKIYLPYDSIVNAFGLSLSLGSVPNAFSQFLSNLSINLNSYIDLDEKIFHDFVSYLRKVQVEKSKSPNFIEKVNQINLNHLISTETVLNELQTLKVEEVREVFQTIIRQSQISGVIYGNLTPLDAEKYLSRLFSNLNGETPKKKTLIFKFGRKSGVSMRLRYSRMINKISSRRTKTRKIALSKRKKSLTKNNDQRTKISNKAKIINRIKTTNKTKSTNKTKMIKSEMLSRSKLYKLYSSAVSKSNSEECKNLQILDMSSIRPISKFFLYENTNDKVNVSILWIYIDKASPESFIFTQYLKLIIENRLNYLQKNNNNINTYIKNYHISSSSYLISIEGSSSKEDSNAINELLLSYLDTFIFSDSSIFNLDLFNSTKEFLVKKYKKEGHYLDSLVVNIFEEIINKRFDFTRFRSVVNLLDRLTFENFTSNLEKVRKSAFYILYSMSYKSQPIVPNGFTHLLDSTDIFKLHGIKTFKPAYSRVDKQLNNLP